MKEVRATRDPAVIAAWATQCASYRRRSRTLAGYLAVTLLVPSAILVVVHKPEWIVIVFFAVAAVAIPMHGVRRTLLACPNCRQSPIGAGSRTSVDGVDCCDHCLYWLKDPIGNADGQWG